MERITSSMQASTSQLARHVRPSAKSSGRHLRYTRRSTVTVRAGGSKDAGSVLRDALQAGQSGGGYFDTSYREGAVYLAELGINSQNEVVRILDTAMNPNSLYKKKGSKLRGVNASARRLSVEDDMQPVVAFLKECGLSNADVAKVISVHPPVLSYNVESHLRPLFDALTRYELDACACVAARPTLLGLKGGDALDRIVSYLQANDYSQEQIAEYLSSSL